MVRLHPDTTRPTRVAPQPDRRVRSSFFRLGIWIGHLDDPVLALAQRFAGVAPRAALLPTPTGVVQYTPDRIGADVRQPIRGTAERLPQGRERPGGGTLHLPNRY